jgi:hypothetical protein
VYLGRTVRLNEHLLIWFSIVWPDDDVVESRNTLSTYILTVKLCVLNDPNFE